MRKIPFADAALLIPVQVGMLAAITATDGLPVGEGFMTTLAGSTVGATAATFTSTGGGLGPYFNFDTFLDGLEFTVVGRELRLVGRSGTAALARTATRDP